MNIYFSCSITGGRDDQAIYRRIVDFILEKGHVVPTAHLASLDAMEDESSMDAVEIFHRDMNWVKNCDGLVAEVSTPSHGVGYEIAEAVNLGKPVLCCYQEGKNVSKIITGNTSKGVAVFSYANEADLLCAIGEFLGTSA